MHSGSCLGGTVLICVDGPLNSPDACHCKICRKVTGHYLVSIDISRENLTVRGIESVICIGTESVTWFQSSPRVRRRFCSKGGSTLFFDPVKGSALASVAMAAFDQPTKVKSHIHIFVSKKGDYYEITDGLPKNDR